VNLAIQLAIGGLLIVWLVRVAMFIWVHRRLPAWREPTTHGKWINPQPRLGQFDGRERGW
jgi:hypothetical protein